MNTTTLSPHLAPRDVRDLAMRLLQGVEGPTERARNGQDPDLAIMLAGQGGWNMVNVLRTAAMCAFLKSLPVDHPDVVLVRQGLAAYGIQAPGA